MGEAILVLGIFLMIFVKVEFFWHALAFSFLGLAVMVFERWDRRRR